MDHVQQDADPEDSLEVASSAAPRLEGQRVAFIGRLAAMPRREAVRLVRRHGGTVVESTENPTLVVWGDEQARRDVALESGNREIHREQSGATDDSSIRAQGEVAASPGAGQESPRTSMVESHFWQYLGLVDDCEVRRLYTPAMLAELLSVPASWIRRWATRGLLHPVRRIHRLSYFDFEETVVARRLSQLQQAGCTLRAIERRLGILHRLRPGLERPLADPSVVVEGRRILWRRDAELAEPHGQLLLDFDQSEEEGVDAGPRVVSLAAGRDVESSATESELTGTGESMQDRLQREAADWEDQGDYRLAAEAYRALLMSSGPSAEWQFALAEALYRSGDLGAARERYYAALECDEEFVEARANLGCVLAETDELELAVATFEGALRYHPDFADVHFHLADTWDRLGDGRKAALHYHAFLALAPESPWAAAARDRLAGTESLSVVGVVGPTS